MQTNGSIIGLDVGDRRIGVAIAGSVSRLAHPLVTLDHTAAVFTELQRIIDEHQTHTIIVGLPRGLGGQNTAQTEAAKTFAQKVATSTGLPVQFQDEAVTSIQAEAELKRRGKPFAKGDIDALAATYILEDYLHSLSGVAHE